MNAAEGACEANENSFTEPSLGSVTIQYVAFSELQCRFRKWRRDSMVEGTDLPSGSDRMSGDALEVSS